MLAVPYFLPKTMDNQHTLPHFLEHQALILDSLPLAISIKDKNLEYVYLNRMAKKLNGFDRSGDFLEKNDHDMPWYDQAKLFQNGGRKVLTGEALVSLDPILNQRQQNMTLLTRQNPIYDLSGCLGPHNRFCISIYKIES
ncbi:MAG: PAS domain-containing protein, partial [Francisellaceae bacterium]